MTNPLARHIDPLPLIAVLRGITPEEIPAVGAALVAHGFGILEVPLNSPRPYEWIAILAAKFGNHVSWGGNGHRGRRGGASGRGRWSPHRHASCRHRGDPRGEAAGLVCVPGSRRRRRPLPRSTAARTGSRCFPPTSCRHRAQGLACGAAAGTLVFAVGGIRPDNMGPYWSAGQRVRHGIEPLSTRRNRGTCRSLPPLMPQRSALPERPALTPGSR
jgi:2-dehydro-3-deoxyphosphogalactonate aldolase